MGMIGNVAIKDELRGVIGSGLKGNHEANSIHLDASTAKPGLTGRLKKGVKYTITAGSDTWTAEFESADSSTLYFKVK